MDHTRHLGIFNANNTSVDLIGLGGIGAMTALVLGKMGIGLINIFDDDTVDEVNIATQFHKFSDIGNPKALATRNALREFTGEENSVSGIMRVNKDTTSLFSEIIVSAVDSITARQEIWTAVLENKPRWYLDARMSAETFQLYCVDMRNAARVAQYGDRLMCLNEGDVADEPCTSKATIYCGTLAAAWIGFAVRSIITKKELPNILLVNMPAMNMFTV